MNIWQVKVKSVLSSNDYSTNFGSEFPFLPHPNNGFVLAEVSHNKAKMPRCGRPLLAGKFAGSKGILFNQRTNFTYNIHSKYPTKLAYGRENEKEFWQRKCNRDVKKEGCELIMFLQSPAVL